MKLSYFDLSGRVALVTGGATGIGRGIAEGLAEAGASIVIASRRREVCEAACKEISEAAGVEALGLACDVSDSKDIKALVSGVISHFGHIDILVNNSGTGGSEKPVIQMEEEDWDRVMETNLKGVFLLSREAGNRMIEQGKGGKIINVASVGGLKVFTNMSSYCASKAGCIQLTKVMASEWARYNIQVNAILPGYFQTPMNKEFFSSDMGKKIIKSKILMRRLGSPEEMKGLAIMLASDASNYMTGSAVVIDGGHILT